MLFFAYDSFKKAKDVEATGKDIACLFLAAHFFYLGNALYEQKDFEDSIKAYSTSLELHEYAEAYNNRGLAYARLGKYSRAIKDYDKAIKLKPDYAGAYNNRGIAYAELGEYDRAIKDYDKAIELNPDLAEAYGNRGVAYAKLGEHKRAIEDFNKAIKLNPDLAEVYNNRGLAYAELGERKRAIEDYDKAIELNPDLAEAYGNRGVAYARLGEHDRAREDMLRAGNLFTNKRRMEDAIRACTVIFNIGKESERVIAGHILLLHSYISGSDSVNDIKERLNEKGYMGEEVLRNAVERLERREESGWLIHIFSELRNVYNRMRDGNNSRRA